MSWKQFIVHAGMPKTGTTHLQKTVFPRITDIAYIGRPFGLADDHAKRISQFLKGKRGAESVAHDIDSLFRLTDKDVLISHEGITGVALPHTIRGNIRIEDLVSNITNLCRACLLAGYSDFKIIIVVRQHEEWFASRYANLAKHTYFVSQSGFERFVKQALRKEKTQPSALNYKKLYSLLCKRIGEDRVCFLKHEDMINDKKRFSGDLARFIEKDREELIEFFETSKRTHVLRDEVSGKWSLRGYTLPWNKNLRYLVSVLQKKA